MDSSDGLDMTLAQLRLDAQSSYPSTAWDYFEGAAGAGHTAMRNRDAFDALVLRMRLVHDVDHANTGVSFFGVNVAAPIGIAPIGSLDRIRSEAWRQVAGAAEATGTPLFVSQAAGVPPSTWASWTTSPLVFMSYLTLGREESKDLMAEAEASGFAALGLTIDSLMPGSSAWSAASSGYDEAPETDAAWTLRAATRTRQNFAARPSDIEWVKENTSLPVVVKGVMGAADAAAAVSAGADAVVVSNHGGRLLDSAQSALEQLPEVVEAVAGNAVVLVDGGIRSGTDVAKAIALGADLTLVGRPICWGLVEGSTGVVKTLQALQAGLERAMIFTGCATIADIGPEILAPASFGHLQSRISGT